MPYKKLVLAAAIIFVIAIFFSCSSSNSESSDINPSLDERRILLFTDENQPEIERHYYNALLYFQNEIPIETNIDIIRENENESLLEEYKVDEFPTLILVSDDQSLTRINGEKKTDEIIDVLEHHFSTLKK